MRRTAILVLALMMAGQAGAQDLSTQQLSALVQSYRTQLTSAIDQVAQLNAQLILSNKEIADLQQQVAEAKKGPPTDPSGK